MSGVARSFDVLVRSNDELEPPPAARMEEVRRWLAAAGVECELTTFGLACRTGSERIAELFGSSDESVRELAVPEGLEGLVSQITIAPSPTMFAGGAGS